VSLRGNAACFEGLAIDDTEGPIQEDVAGTSDGSQAIVCCSRVAAPHRLASSSWVGQLIVRNSSKALNVGQRWRKEDGKDSQFLLLVFNNDKRLHVKKDELTCHNQTVICDLMYSYHPVPPWHDIDQT
jgi:hypothetical protein